MQFGFWQLFNSKLDAYGFNYHLSNNFLKESKMSNLPIENLIWNIHWRAFAHSNQSVITRT